MNPSMGRPVADLDDFLEPAQEQGLRAVSQPVETKQPARSKASWWIVGAAALLIAAGVSYWFFDARTSPESVVGPSTPQAAPMPEGVSGFAEMYVATYLTGSSEDIAVFLPAAPATSAMTPAAHYVTRVAAMDASAVDDGYWSVLVAADVLSLGADGYVPSGLQYFQVGIVDDGGRLVAAALPARVAAPATRRASPRSLQTADGTPTEAQAALAGDFLEALLTGGRDIGRYTTTESGLGAVTPPPYSAIVITSIGVYDPITLVVTLDAQAAGGTITTMQYVLQLQDEGAGLVVAQLLAGPPPISTEGDN